MGVEQQLREALSELDNDILEAERRVKDAERGLEELRQRRLGAEGFIEYFVKRATSPTTTGPEPASTDLGDTQVVVRSALSPTAVVEKIIRAHDLRQFHTRDVAAIAEHDAPALTKNQISNGLTYLRRLNFITPGPKKGTWTRAEPGTVLSGSNDSGPADSAGPEEASDNEFPSQGAVVVGAFGASQPAR